MVDPGATQGLSPAVASYVRRDIEERPVVWVHTADDTPLEGTNSWLREAGDSLERLALLPCVLLPGAEGPAPAHALVLKQSPARDEIAAVEKRARQALIASILESQIARPAGDDSGLRFSVIIPTYRRLDQVVEAVRACCELAYPPEAYEVIVADNGPDREPLQQALAPWYAHQSQAEPALQLVHMPVKSVSMARNAAIAVARGQFICSIDDDCRPAPDWLAALDEAWQVMPGAGVIGGQLLLEVPDPVPDVFQPGWEAIWSHLPLGGDQLIRCEDWRSYPWGGNWSTRRNTLMAVGGFPWRYGSRGCSYAGGEEVALSAAIALTGLPIYLSPTATVVHRPSSVRYNLDHVRSTMASSAILEHRLYRDGLIAQETSALGTAGQMLRAAGTMAVAGLIGKRDMARDRQLRLGALGNKLLVQLGWRQVYHLVP